MGKKSTRLHRGQLLKEAVDAKRLSKEEVAARAGYTRSAYYKHIQEPDLPYHILASYGRAIKQDFTEYLPEMPKYIIEEPEANYTQELNLEDAKKQIEYWRGKYIDLLEQFNKLVLELKGK